MYEEILSTMHLKRTVTLSFRNMKLVILQKYSRNRVACLDQPAGHTCPMANICKAKVIPTPEGWRLRKYGKFKCYATKPEAMWASVREARWSNYALSLLDDFPEMVADAIHDAKVDIFRIHSSGDFYTYGYFRKWVDVARWMPNVSFWAYTKQATFVAEAIRMDIPNLKLVYSNGGLLDEYAEKNDLPTCYVRTPENADWLDSMGIPTLCGKGREWEDYYAILNGETFALGLH